MLCVTFLSILKFALVDQRNRILNNEEYVKTKSSSRVNAIIIISACMLAYFVTGPISKYELSTSMGALTASISLAIGSIKRGGEGKTRLKSLRKYAGISFAFVGLFIAQIASTRFSFIFYQDTVPESVKALKK